MKKCKITSGGIFWPTLYIGTRWKIQDRRQINKKPSCRYDSRPYCLTAGSCRQSEGLIVRKSDSPTANNNHGMLSDFRTIGPLTYRTFGLSSSHPQQTL